MHFRNVGKQLPNHKPQQHQQENRFGINNFLSAVSFPMGKAENFPLH
jgi:hypothetical protein